MREHRVVREEGRGEESNVNVKACYDDSGRNQGALLIHNIYGWRGLLNLRLNNITQKIRDPIS